MFKSGFQNQYQIPGLLEPRTPVAGAKAPANPVSRDADRVSIGEEPLDIREILQDIKLKLAL
jgi:hypothetical protein